MKNIYQTAIRSIMALSLATGVVNSYAQTNENVDAGNYQIIIEPLFEYPTAPETLEGLQEKSDWLMDHFWDKMDFKNKTTVDQNALNDAFATYVTPMRFADVKKAEESVKKLISSISKNAALSYQFAKAAEEALYGPRAELWNDDIFLMFIDNVLKNKSIKAERKVRYQRLSEILKNSKRGSVPPEFDYVSLDGKTSHYHPNGVITVIEFGTPDCLECRLIKLRMESDVTFSSLVEKGKINVLFINPMPEEKWQEKMSEFPSSWYVGASDKVVDLFDMRITPSLYVIDREGKIAAKNITVESAMQIATAAAQQ